MQTQSHLTPMKPLPRPVPRKPDHHTTGSTWKPEQVGLTREELRDIVIELIG